MNLTNKFSLTRMAMLWRYYSPGMNRPLLLTAAVTLLAYLVALMATFLPSGFGLYTAATFVLMLAYYCGPLHFARFNDRTFSAQLPATAAERTCMLFSYTMIEVPAVMATVWFMSIGVASFFAPNAPVMNFFMDRMADDAATQAGIDMPFLNSSMLGLQRVQDIIPMLVCMLCVVSSRRTPVTNGIIGIVVALVGMSVLGGIGGIVLALTSGVSAAMSGEEFNQALFLASFTSMLIYLVYLIAVVALVTLVYSVIRIYRTFRHRQV